jgi:hypothetical protein
LSVYPTVASFSFISSGLPTSYHLRDAGIE